MKRALWIMLLCGLAACNTYKAAEGNSSGTSLADGVKQDAAAAGKAIEHAATEVGDAINKSLK